MTLPPVEVEKRIAQAVESGISAVIQRGNKLSEDNFFYLSFVDPDRPKGTQWLGACCIPADSFDEALVLSHAFKINPGGEVAFMGPFPLSSLNEGYANRMLDRNEVELAVDPAKLS